MWSYLGVEKSEVRIHSCTGTIPQMQNGKHESLATLHIFTDDP